MEQCWVFEDDKLLIFSSEEAFQEYQITSNAEFEQISAGAETIILFDYKELLKSIRHCPSCRKTRFLT